MRSRNSFSKRLVVVSVLCVAAACCVIGRMYYLTVVRGPELAGQAERITCGDSVRIAYRGPILDRNGSMLATSIAASRVAMRRNEYVYDPTHAAELGPLLHYDVAALDQLLRADPRRFIWLSKSVGIDEATALHRMAIPGIDVHSDQRRNYPQGPLAAHLVGFVGTDAQGLEGIERLLDGDLAGESQTVRVCKDVRGRVFYSNSNTSGANKGAAVEVTIDATLQSIAEAELNRQIDEYGASGGSVVILEPSTGEVLVMANAPSFDPNVYRRSPVANRRNRAITDVFEPGSTMKPFLIAAALDTGTVVPTDVFFCENGAMRIGGWTIHDHHPHGRLTIPEIIQVSSNICSAKVGEALGAESFYRYLTAFGFGRKSGIGLVGDSTGMLMAADRWRAINLANISFGQGMAVSAMQLASAFSVLANDGVRMRPFVVRRVTLADGTVSDYQRPEVESRVVAAKTARQLTGMLEAVVAPGGTAPQAQIDGLRVAGKTGTAQKAENGRYSREHWVASFVGYLPADDPQMVIAVIIDEPKKNHYGGIVAAPVFRRIAEASLDYMHIHRTPELSSPALTIEASAPEPSTPHDVSFDGTMPDLRGLSLRSAMHAMEGCECAVEIAGSGYVVSQQPDPGVQLVSARSVSLTLDGVVGR